MRNILFCILFVFIQLYCKSQVAGYMGKRFTVGLSSSLAPNFKILYLLDNPQSPYLGPVITNSLNIEYFPTHIVIDKEGIVRQVIISYSDDIKEKLQWL